jgi:hypothetical protein
MMGAGFANPKKNHYKSATPWQVNQLGFNRILLNRASACDFHHINPDRPIHRVYISYHELYVGYARYNFLLCAALCAAHNRKLPFIGVRNAVLRFQRAKADGCN